MPLSSFFSGGSRISMTWGMKPPDGGVNSRFCQILPKLKEFGRPRGGVLPHTPRSTNVSSILKQFSGNIVGNIVGIQTPLK